MKFDPSKRLMSFTYAFRGLGVVLSQGHNFRIHLAVACIVVPAGLVARLTAIEWCIVVLSIFLVLAMEVMNTAIEKLVDFVSPGFHRRAGAVKDISAAAVLLTAIGAVIAGMIIFLPRLI
jgi:diacylglycerol kinase